MPTPPTEIDLLIEPQWLIPVAPAGVVLEDHALAVDHGIIIGLLPAREAAIRYAPHERLTLPGHVLLPGLINLHTHAAMALLRGYADDLPLMRWLNERVWPAEGKHVSPTFVHDGTLLASWEMLRRGITCFNDMYFHPEAAARAAIEAGIRTVQGVTVIEFPTGYASGPAEYLDKGLAARDALRDEPLVAFCLAPHAPYTVADHTFERVAILAAELDLPIHVHIHETRAEIEDSLKQFGVRPMERLRRLGMLGPNLIAVHATHLTHEEIDLIGKHGCTVAHCPTSNMKLASGIAPVATLLRAGIRTGLGTDGAASNNRLDLFREMSHAALLAKVASGDASALGAHQALRMATLDGAAALGLDRRIGSLTVGKEADLCAVRLDDWVNQPCYDPASHLVYVAGRESVSHVWVGGRIRIRDGQPTGLDQASLLDMVSSWHNKISS